MAAKDKRSESSGTVFKVGGIAFAFLIIGYQSALFVQRAAELRIASLRDHPDTVYVYLPADAADAAAADGQAGHRAILKMQAEPQHFCSMSEVPALPAADSGGVNVVRRNARHEAAVEQVRRRTHKVESFRFNPNTAGIDDLMRLGFSEKQAQAIDSYRAKGGRFRRPSDFAKSYVVADSVYQRLKPYIVIPKVDINKADSAAFDDLPGIGPYFAAKMVEYRGRLGGYSYKEQLMDIWHFDREKYDGLSDLIVCSPPPAAFRLWQMAEDSLRLHPYIRNWQTAHSIVLFRKSMPLESWTVEALGEAGILPPEDASRLARCRIAAP